MCTIQICYNSFMNCCVANRYLLYLNVTNASYNSNKNMVCSPLKLLIINCQSILAKESSFLNLINNNNSDFLFGTESWLSPNVHSGEIFPPTYTAFRCDRGDSCGGVFIACKSISMCEEITPSTSNEIVACCIHLKNQSIIVISAYRLPNNNFEYLNTLCSIISSIILANPKDIFIWLGVI